MKNWPIILILIFLSLGFKEQESSTPDIPNITVTGSAEMTVVPDIINLEIVISNFSKSSLFSMEKAEGELLKVLENHKIPSANISFISQNSSLYYYFWWENYRRSYYTKTFKLKIETQQNDMSFIKDLNEKTVQSIRVVSTTHSKMDEYRKQIKIEAMKACKSKVDYLLQSIGQKAGRALEIEEIEGDENIVSNRRTNYYSYSNTIVDQTNAISESSKMGMVTSIEPIRIRYELKSRFEIL